MTPPRARRRREHALRVALRVLGLGTALLGVAALLAREAVEWGIATLVVSVGALWCSFTRSRRRMRRAMPFVVAGAMMFIAGLGFAGSYDVRPGFILATIAISVASLIVGTLEEYPELRGGPRHPHRREVTP